MTDRHLVTAAHCLAGVESSLNTRVDILMADYNTGDSFTGIRRKMARVLIHPDFNEETLQNALRSSHSGFPSTSRQVRLLRSLDR